MKPLSKGLIVALIHIAIISSLGAKLLYDRATRPRIWVRTGSVDPDLPIRGRYLTLSLEVHVPDYAKEPNHPPGQLITKPRELYDSGEVELSVENQQLIARQTQRPTGIRINTWGTRARTDDVFLLSTPVLFFLPEHAEVPRTTRAGDELWAEVTVPRKGPPRPIQLALKHGQEWIPLTYR